MNVVSDIVFRIEGFLYSFSVRQPISLAFEAIRAMHGGEESKDMSPIKHIIYTDSNVLIMAENGRHCQFNGVTVISSENSK